jgi:carbon monoxide dehydrogenase subunit G
MKLHEEFTVAEPAGAVWKFLEQPEWVASCMPGVEFVNILDEDNVRVRATQSVGPMTATFDAKVTVLERAPEELIRFRAAGRSVRGAIGNMRTECTVRLRNLPDGTSVAVDADMVLAGALGSVGQKVIAKQAGRVTAEFATNLRRALGGEVPAPLSTGSRAGTIAGGGPAGEVPAGTPFLRSVFPALRARPRAAPAPDRWSRVAAALSAVSVVLSVIVLVRQRGRAR